MLPFFQEYQYNLVEENYFDHGNNILSDYGDDVVEIAIGHSLGFWKLCQELPKVKYLIGLNAFTNFLGKDSKLHTSRILEYEKFKTGFYQNPKNTLQNFYKRCGIKYSDNDFLHINTQNITDDLNLLAKPVRLSTESKILIINSLDDLVVPKNITEDNFVGTKAQIHYLKSGGKHSIGFCHAKEVSKMILDFVA